MVPKGDATTLDNMIEALKFIQEANQLRAKEGLQPLKVSDTLMAQAMAGCGLCQQQREPSTSIPRQRKPRLGLH